jgi:hypothetical protein
MEHNTVLDSDGWLLALPSNNRLGWERIWDYNGNTYKLYPQMLLTWHFVNKTITSIYNTLAYYEWAIHFLPSLILAFKAGTYQNSDLYVTTL